MPNYIRAKFEGGYYFFTVVTYQRAELFRSELARRVLREAIEKTRSRRPFETIAFCLLFEHLHCIWKLPENDADYSKYAKEELYGRVNDFENVTNISTEGFGE